MIFYKYFSCFKQKSLKEVEKERHELRARLRPKKKL